MSFNIGKTSFFISPLFALLISIILLVDTTGIMLFGFTSAFFHELGHIICMVCRGKTIDKIALSPCGILIDTSGISTYKSDLLVALCGPLTNLLLFVISAFVLSIYKTNSLLYFCAANFGLFLFNILPVFGLDGMDVIKAMLLKKHSYTKTQKICKNISLCFLVFCLVLGAVCVYLDKINPTFLICLIYLLIISLLNAKK